MIVVDDHHLFRVLAGQIDGNLAGLAVGGVATTGSWFFRLTRATVGQRIDGSLSRLLATLSTVVTKGNFLTLEALALAGVLGADIITSTESLILNEGAARLHVGVHLLAH